MKKFLLSISFLFICSTAQAATTWYACSGGGNWNGASVWTSVQVDQVGCIASTGNPVAGDTAILNSTSGNITISAAAAAAVIDETGYTGTLAFGTQTATITGTCTLGSAMTNTSGTLSCAGGVTLLATPTGTFPTLTLAGSQTITFSSYNWPGNVKVGAFTITMADATDTISGDLTLTGSAILTSNTLAVGGNFHEASFKTTGTATILLNGTGTWDDVGGSNGTVTTSSITINTSGTITLGANLYYSTGTITYTAGTVNASSNTIQFVGNTTLNTNGMTWGTFATNAGNNTLTTTSPLQVTNFEPPPGQLTTINGGYAITFSNFTFTENEPAISGGVTLAAATTLIVTNSFFAHSCPQYTLTFKSGTPSSPIYFSYLGQMKNFYSSNITYTDVIATRKVYNFVPGSTTTGTQVIAALTRTSGITNVNASNFQFPRTVNSSQIAG